MELKSVLRNQMQLLLDEVQSTVENELDKVSLERLADIDPNLLMSIKREAESILGSGRGGPSSGGMTGKRTADATARNNLPDDNVPPPYFTETRPPSAIEISKEWEKEWEKPSLQQTDINQLVKSLADFHSLTKDTLYSQPEAEQMTGALAAAAVTSIYLNQALQQMEQEVQKSVSVLVSTSAAAANATRVFHTVDKNAFTNEGIKVKDATVVASLYEGGLPFVSSSDGRRFATEIELSNHLDYLFKRKYVVTTCLALVCVKSLPQLTPDIVVFVGVCVCIVNWKSPWSVPKSGGGTKPTRFGLVK